jgi:hypothetical protein
VREKDEKNIRFFGLLRDVGQLCQALSPAGFLRRGCSDDRKQPQYTGRLACPRRKALYAQALSSFHATKPVFALLG